MGILYGDGFLRFPFAQDTCNVDLGVVGIVGFEETDFLQLFAESSALLRTERSWLLADAAIGFFAGEFLNEMCVMSVVAILTGIKRGRGHCTLGCREALRRDAGRTVEEKVWRHPGRGEAAILRTVLSSIMAVQNWTQESDDRIKFLVPGTGPKLRNPWRQRWGPLAQGYAPTPPALS
jgi:hypothetical protein